LLGRPIFTISKQSRHRLQSSARFGHGAITNLPNTFYAFENLLSSHPSPGRAKSSILMCTGSTANKDFESVVRDYLPEVLAAGFYVSVLGLHKTSDAARLAPLGDFVKSGRLTLCGQLTDSQVAEEYQRHNIVWVHSLREGFGRCVVEGRLAGARVICTDIPEFVELRDDDVYLYKGPADFLPKLEHLRHMDSSARPYTSYPYRELLRTAVGADLQHTVRPTGLSAADRVQAASAAAHRTRGVAHAVWAQNSSN